MHRQRLFHNYSYKTGKLFIQGTACVIKHKLKKKKQCFSQCHFFQYFFLIFSIKTSKKALSAWESLRDHEIHVFHFSSSKASLPFHFSSSSQIISLPFSRGCTFLGLFLEHPCVQYWQSKAPERIHTNTQGVSWGFCFVLEALFITS